MKLGRFFKLTAVAALACVTLGCGNSTDLLTQPLDPTEVFRIIRVSLLGADQQANGPSTSGESLSSNGGFVVFSSSATNLVANDTNGVQDIFVRDNSNGATSRVSLDSADGEANGQSTAPRISADGRFVAFTSQATNLVTGDTNGTLDVFVRDLVNGTTTRVSVDSAEVESNGNSSATFISADGRYVAFHSDATNLVAGDSNGAVDVFIRDTQAGTTVRASLDSVGTQGNSDSVGAIVSSDGNLVAFYSDATNLVAGDSNGLGDIFLKNLQDGSIQRVNLSGTNQQADNLTGPDIDMTPDGRFVSFASLAGNLVTNDTNGFADVFLRDTVAGSTFRASLSSNSTQVTDNGSFNPHLSANGRFVVFSSNSAQFVPDDTNGVEDVFVRDFANGTTSRLSINENGVGGNATSEHVGISADGRFVMFGSDATNLVPNDTNGFRDIFVARNLAQP